MVQKSNFGSKVAFKVSFFDGISVKIRQNAFPPLSAAGKRLRVKRLPDSDPAENFEWKTCKALGVQLRIGRAIAFVSKKLKGLQKGR